MKNQEMQTRRSFISMLTTAVAACAVAPESLAKVTQPSLEPIIPPDDWYRDIRIDRYYITDFPNRMNAGATGFETLEHLLTALRYAEGCRSLDEAVEGFSRYANGGCFHVTEYFKSYRHYEDIQVTDRWIRKFYEIHRDDDLADHLRTELEHVNSIKSYFGAATIDVEGAVASYRRSMAECPQFKPNWKYGGFVNGIYNYPDERLA